MDHLSTPPLGRRQLRTAALILLFANGLVPARAQQGPPTIRLLPEDAQRGLNGHQQNFYFLPPGVEGENYVNAGFFGQKLRPYLAGNEDALANLNRYKKQKTAFLVDRLVAVASFGVYGQQILAHDERQYFNGTQQVAIGVFATSLIASLFISRNTNSYFQRAVGAYNLGHARGAVWPRLRPSSLGLGAAPTGPPVLALHWTLR